jgi:hypothetical protein
LEREVLGDTTICENCQKTISKANFARHRASCNGNSSLPTENQAIQNAIQQEDEDMSDTSIEEVEPNNTLVEENTTPTVVPRPTNKRRKYKLSKTTRTLVWKKYIGFQTAETLCLCCQSNSINCFDFQCGHVVARALGGDDSVENLRPICSICNGSMRTMNMMEFAKNVCKVVMS